MNEALITIVIFALGYLCGIATKHEILVWVMRHGKAVKKTK